MLHLQLEPTHPSFVREPGKPVIDRFSRKDFASEEFSSLNLMFGMSTFWKSAEVSVADVFHIFVYPDLGSVVTVDSHLFQHDKETFQIGLRILFVGCSCAQRLRQG